MRTNYTITWEELIPLLEKATAFFINHDLITDEYAPPVGKCDELTFLASDGEDIVFTFFKEDNQEIEVRDTNGLTIYLRDEEWTGDEMGSSSVPIQILIPLSFSDFKKSWTT